VGRSFSPVGYGGGGLQPRSRLWEVSLFFWARGEQIVGIMNNPIRIHHFLGREVEPEDLTLSDRVDLVGRVLERTVPDSITVWRYPFSSEVTVVSVVQSDPPRLPLYPPVLAVFVLWGVIAALRRPLAGVHPFLFAWTAAICLPLLLTTRVDVHRLMLTIIPLSLWAALGVHRATRTMAACRVPAVAQVGCAALLLMGVAAGNSRFLYHQSSPPVRLSAAVLTELENIEGPVRLVFDTVHRDLGRVELPLLDRQRHSDERLPVKVSKSERDDLLREGGSGCSTYCQVRLRAPQVENSAGHSTSPTSQRKLVRSAG